MTMHYPIQNDGGVLLTKSENEQNDPVIEEFLLFLAKDIERNPQKVHSLDQKFYQRIQNLISKTEIDLEKSLKEEDE